MQEADLFVGGQYFVVRWQARCDLSGWCGNRVGFAAGNLIPMFVLVNAQ